MKKTNTQAEQILKAMKIFRWAFRFIACVILLLTSCFFGTALYEWQTAMASRDWSVVQGRVVSSEVVVASQTSGGGTERTSYRALIWYSYHVGTAKFESVRVSFMGWGSSAGTTERSNKSAAQSDANRYPRGAKVQVFYNPRVPSEAVLEPGATHHNRTALIGSSAALIAAIVFLLVFRMLLSRFFRGAVAQHAEMYGPTIWDSAANYGLAPPLARELEMVERQPRIDLPFEAHAEIVWRKRSVLLEFSGCLAHTEGDFTGNLNVAVRSSSGVSTKTILNKLWLKIPEYDALLSASGYAETEEQLELIFGLADLASSLDVDDLVGWSRKTAMNLKAIELWWGPSGGSQLATVSCTRATES